MRCGTLFVCGRVGRLTAAVAPCAPVSVPNAETQRVFLGRVRPIGRSRGSAFRAFAEPRGHTRRVGRRNGRSAGGGSLRRPCAVLTRCPIRKEERSPDRACASVHTVFQHCSRFFTRSRSRSPADVLSAPPVIVWVYSTPTCAVYSPHSCSGVRVVPDGEGIASTVLLCCVWLCLFTLVSRCVLFTCVARQCRGARGGVSRRPT